MSSDPIEASFNFGFGVLDESVTEALVESLRAFFSEERFWIRNRYIFESGDFDSNLFEHLTNDLRSLNQGGVKNSKQDVLQGDQLAS